MAEQATTLMKSRRRIAFPKAQDHANSADYSRDSRPVKWGLGVSLHGSNPEPPMSALGHKRTLEGLFTMSALPPKADMVQHDRDVRFVPKADIPLSANVYAVRISLLRPARANTDFVGVMNVLWIALLALLAYLERGHFHGPPDCTPCWHHPHRRRAVVLNGNRRFTAQRGLRLGRAINL